MEIGDDIVELEFRLSSAPRESNLALYSRFGQDVMLAADGSIVADYASNDPGGTERILINANSTPAITAGRYYIAIEAGFGNPQTFAFLETSVTRRGASSNLLTISSNDFETFLPEGWTRNYPGPEPFIDGSTLGDPLSTIQAVRLPDRNRALQITTQGNDSFVAPAEYLGNLGLLGAQLRLEFDIKYDAPTPPQTNLEVRVIGPGGTFRWSGPKPTDLFQHIVVLVEPSLWQRLGGTGTFAETLENVFRIEISANFGEQDGKTTLDNVILLGKATAPPLPAMSEFNQNLEGWVPNVPDAPYLQPRISGATLGDYNTARNGLRFLGTDGNPGGFLRLRDLDGDINRDAVVAPSKYLGDWAALGPQARVEFDRRHTSNGGAARGVELRIVGFGGAYAWVGAAPTNQWTHFTAPIQENQWSLVAGERSFEEVLRAVQRIEVSMDEVAGGETSDLDNFEIIVPPAVDPQLSASPQSLVFSITQGEGQPDPQILTLGSNSVQLQWFASSSTDAPWITLSKADGQTPGELAVTVNPSGLPIGVHRGFVELAWLGSSSTLQIPVSFNIVSATGPLISQGGVVNAANYRANNLPGGQLTGGMFVAIFGQRLAERTEQAPSIPLPTSLGGTSISIGGIPAPMVFASDRQLVAVVPQALTQHDGVAQNISEADVVVVRGSEFSPAERVQLTPVRPVLFSQDQTGAGPGAIQNVLGGGQVQLNTFQDPARPLSTVTIYGTGFGPTQTQVLDGFAASGPTTLRGSLRLVVGGVDALVLYPGLSGLPHLYQVNATLDASTPLGCEVPVQVVVDGVESNTVTMAVTRNGEPCQ
ncbi:MAG: hypothetical protein H6509_12305 [Bryobacterales bacterium]|nr:hypothetical protein [Bryobacterales bacterium]